MFRPKKKRGGFNPILIELSIVDIYIPDDLRSLYSTEIFSQVHKGHRDVHKNIVGSGMGLAAVWLMSCPRWNTKCRENLTVWSLSLYHGLCLNSSCDGQLRVTCYVSGKLRLCHNYLSLQMMAVNLVEVCIWKKHCVFIHLTVVGLQPLPGLGECKGLCLQSSGEPDIKPTCRQICDSSNKEK